jgi:8-oxo-dGTP pyrophosphatase MutT (NUDIX family)
MSDYEQSYLGRLRKYVGKSKLIAVGVRAILQDDTERILFVQRRDNGQWVLPAGSMELDESILDACRREVWEETGLTVETATLIAVYSHPRYSIITVYGDPYQIVSFVFRVDKWSGTLSSTTDETIAAQFFQLNALPETSPMYHETITDLQHFDGQVILK